MENLIYFVTVAIISLIFTAFSIPQIVRVSRAKNLFDAPNSRKLNKTMVPNLGGIALFIGIMMGLTIGESNFTFNDLKYIIGSIIIIFFAGLKDDLVSISPRSKIMAQSLSILVIIFFANIRFENLYGFLGIDHIGYLSSFLLTFFTGIVIINAFNLIDGIDGLASLLVIEIVSVFGVWFALAGIPEYATLAFAAVGACITFFAFNVYGNNNKLFMGDTGSLMLGLIIFILAAKFNEVNLTVSDSLSIHSAPAVLIGVLAYPLFDVLRVFFLRVVVCRRSPFSPDKNHIHHRLIALGFSHVQSTILITLVNAVFIVGSILLQNIGVLYLTLILLAVSLILSFGLEFYILYHSKINTNDEHQTLLLPSKFVNAKLNKQEI